MGADLIAPMAVLPLTLGCTVVAEALDPASFTPVSGVVIGPFTIYAIDTGKDAGTASELVAPLWVPLPLEAQA